MIHRAFDLIDSVLTLKSQSSELAAPFLGLIGELETNLKPSGKPSYSIGLRKSKKFPSLPHRKVFYSGTVGAEGLFEFARNDTHWCIDQPGNISARFSLIKPESELIITAGCPSSVAGFVSGFALDQAIGVGNQCMIHAACLDTPNGKARIIIHAPSGTGKTTAALALVEAGFKLCSDDATVIGPYGGASISAWGLPRNLKVHRNTVAMLPWLNPMIDPLKWNEEDEQVIARADLSKFNHLAQFIPKPVAAVIELTRTGGANTSFTKVDRFDGLAALTAENIQFNSTGLLPGHERRFDLYSRLISNVKPVQLSVSNDMKSIVEAVQEIINI